MPKSTRLYSPTARKAAELLGLMIRAARLGRNMTSQELAERGISTIEKVIADEMGLPLKINFLNGGRDTPPQSETSQKKLDPHPNDEKLFNKIVEVFDGEILR